MIEYEGSHVFHQTWQQIAAAIWQKYPNKYSKHILSEDIISRDIDHSTGQLVTKRLFVKTSPIPSWLNILVRTNRAFILEESFVDPIRQTFKTITRNVGVTQLLSVKEVCVYRPYTEAPSLINIDCEQQRERTIGTKLERKTIFVTSLTGLKRRALFKFVLERYKQNIRRSDLGLTCS